MLGEQIIAGQLTNIDGNHAEYKATMITMRLDWALQQNT
jgi:hypothetical protein